MKLGSTQWLIMALMFVSVQSVAGALVHISASSPVKLCEFTTPVSKVPTFTEPECSIANLIDVDPQGRHIWVSIDFDTPQRLREMRQPLGLFVFAKASSRAFLNGELVGVNGTPGSKASEVAGKMDVVFPLTPSQLKPENNTLVLELSAQQSVLQLGYPIHFIGIGEYTDPSDYIQQYAPFGLILVGAFLVGGIYFGVLAFLRKDQSLHIISSVMCLMAGAHLLTEMSRGLVSYTYPWHDVRLLAVTTFSCLFGLMLLTFSAFKVSGKHAVHWIYTGAFCTILCVFFAQGFDIKTTLGIFIPLLFSVVQVFMAWFRSRSRHLIKWLLVQVAVAILISFSSANFHEITYFAIIACVLCYLFIQHAKEQHQSYVQLQDDKVIIAKLEYQLAQSQQIEKPMTLEVSLGGKLEYLEANQIAYCKASGDYVEIYLVDDSEKLYSGSLKQLEGILPATFLRVHRSYLVNLKQVTSLATDKSDDKLSSVLNLQNNQQVPVSRRLLPSVKSSIRSTFEQ